MCCVENKASGMTLSSQERKDLEKYTKFFALKMAQVIVQSRQGEKVTTLSNPDQNSSKNDWFNLNVGDDERMKDFLREFHSLLNKDFLSEEMPDRIPLVVEISLKTPDGQEMVLEYWCLNLNRENCDTTSRVTKIYSQMGVLLRSLVSLTRITPAYKYSRRQGPESFVICYQVYLSDPDMTKLGEGFKQTRIGQICTPISAMHLSVAYRTKVTFSPTQPGRDSIMLKSDHFNANVNARKNQIKQTTARSAVQSAAQHLPLAVAPPPILHNDPPPSYHNHAEDKNEDLNDLTKPMALVGPFASPKQFKAPEPQLPDVTRLLALGKNKPRKNPKSESDTESSCCTSMEDNNKQEEKEKQDSIQDSAVTISNRIQDLALIDNSTSVVSTSPTKVSLLNMMKELPSHLFWSASYQDLAALATPTAVGEWIHFCQTWSSRPSLKAARYGPTADEIHATIENFESKMSEYDAMVQSFCESPES